ncbi:hypothetical protein Purlil1_11059 [Purpureocillium lilacinum]|uniref:Uncharacterized protein n=1 Tax=Purpureocillium lilacinum TaxID=33203 RepID=A0ABR0BKN4_PURLI|nr:hypothetical protein Purlil1_11059 [Purpureocillium lilacinum]
MADASRPRPRRLGRRLRRVASSGGASLRTGIVRARSTSRAALDEAVGALRPVAAGMAARRGCWSGGDGEGGMGPRLQQRKQHHPHHQRGGVKQAEAVAVAVRTGEEEEGREEGVVPERETLASRVTKDMISWPLETPGRDSATTTTNTTDGGDAIQKKKRHGFVRRKEDTHKEVGSPPPSPPPTPRPLPTPPRTPVPQQQQQQQRQQQQDGVGSVPAWRDQGPAKGGDVEEDGVVSSWSLLLSVMMAKVQNPRRKPLPLRLSIALPPRLRSSITTTISVSPCSSSPSSSASRSSPSSSSPSSATPSPPSPPPSTSSSVRASSFPLPPQQLMSSNSAADKRPRGRRQCGAAAGASAAAAAAGAKRGKAGTGRQGGKLSPRPDSTTLPRSPSSCRHSFPPRTSSLDPERFYALLQRHRRLQYPSHYGSPLANTEAASTAPGTHPDDGGVDGEDQKRTAVVGAVQSHSQSQSQTQSQKQPQTQTHYWLSVEDVLAGLPGRHHLPAGHWEGMLELAHAVRVVDARNSGYDWVQLVTGWCEDEGEQRAGLAR